MAILTYKVRCTSTPTYLTRHIKPREDTRHLRSSSLQLLQKPTTGSHFADRAFRCTAPSVWNSLNSYIVDSCSLAVFKSRLKTCIFRQTFKPVIVCTYFSCSRGRGQNSHLHSSQIPEPVWIPFEVYYYVHQRSRCAKFGLSRLSCYGCAHA